MIRSCSRRSASRDFRRILSRDLRRTSLWLGLGTSGRRSSVRRKRRDVSRCWRAVITDDAPRELTGRFLSKSAHAKFHEDICMREPSSKRPAFKTATEDATMRLRIGRLVALAAMVFALATATWAAGPEVDPASVSDGLKAIFKYGKGQRETVDRLNANTVTLMSGTIGGTYVQFGADLASALDDGDNLRVLSIIGRGSVQGVADILFLKGVDLGIVRSDTLDYLEKKGYANNIK